MTTALVRRPGSKVFRRPEKRRMSKLPGAKNSVSSGAMTAGVLAINSSQLRVRASSAADWREYIGNQKKGEAIS